MVATLIVVPEAMLDGRMRGRSTEFFLSLRGLMDAREFS